MEKRTMICPGPFRGKSHCDPEKCCHLGEHEESNECHASLPGCKTCVPFEEFKTTIYYKRNLDACITE